MAVPYFGRVRAQSRHRDPSSLVRSIMFMLKSSKSNKLGMYLYLLTQIMLQVFGRVASKGFVLHRSDTH
jgi:hypothetical protein